MSASFSINFGFKTNTNFNKETILKELNSDTRFNELIEQGTL